MAFLFRKKQHEQVRSPRIVDNNDAYVFRRSRTMTGSLSNSVRAAGEDRGELKSSRLKHHDLHHRRRRLFAKLVVVVCAAAGLFSLLNQFIPGAQLSLTSTVPDVVRVPYTEVVQKYLRAHPTERFFFSLNQGALSDYVQKEFPEVKRVWLQPTTFLGSADTHVVLRSPIAIWTLQGVKYYIDEHGVAYEHNYLAEPTLVVEDKTGINPADAGAVASERMIRYTGRLVALVQAAGYRVEKVELPPNTSREIDLRLEGKGYTIKTYLDRDPAGQAADVVSAVKYLDSKQIIPTYVDVRVSSKAYYL